MPASTSSSSFLPNSAAPRYATKRNPDLPTRGGDIARVAEMLGTPLMPWQRQVADIIGEYDPATGLPTHRTIVITVPRQSGKTTLMLAVVVWRALFSGTPVFIAYTAQTGKDAKDKLRLDWFKLLERSPLAKAINRKWEGIADTAIEFKGGSRLSAINAGEASGHGMSIDLAICDEVWKDEDFRREQALRPAMVTKPEAQLIAISTMGTDKSNYLNSLVESGRFAIEKGTPGPAYFEWSAEDGADPHDPKVWATCMPALGYTASVETVRKDIIDSGMKLDEVRRAYLNQRTKSDEQIIPPHLWAEQVDDNTVPRVPVVLAVDIRPDRSAGAIAAADVDGRVEVGEHRGGVAWIPDRAVELAERLGAPVVIDAYGPAANLADVLESRGVDVVRYGSQQLAQACATFYDKAVNKRLSVRRHDGLDAAVAGARRRTLGDAWAWARKDELTDISPLVAATLAVFHASKPPDEPDPGLVSHLLE